MSYIDAAVLNATEFLCHRFQRLTGRTNVWLAVQLTNLSVILYFVWAALSFWNTDAVLRIVVGFFCAGVFYVLTQTVFKVPIEEYENNAYRRVAKGYRNPRRVRDALLRISFLTLSIVLWYPALLAYVNLRIRIGFLSYFLVVLMTLLLYLLACDPLPPCAGKIREWLNRTAPVPGVGDARPVDGRSQLRLPLRRRDGFHQNRERLSKRFGARPNALVVTDAHDHQSV